MTSLRGAGAQEAPVAAHSLLGKMAGLSSDALRHIRAGEPTGDVESSEEKLGGHAMLNGLSTALFTLTMRLASEAAEAPAGLLALAGHPRLAPALSALFRRPEREWTLPDLAALCGMSRATFVRHFQQRLGRTATDLLTDIRMTVAARELRNSNASAGAIAEAVGYQSEAAFQRVFKKRVGATPAQFRKRTSQ